MCFTEYASRPFLGMRSPGNPFKYLTYQQVESLSFEVLLALRRLGIHPPCVVGVLCGVSVWYPVVVLACLFGSLTVVPLQTILTPEERQHIVEQTEMTVLFCAADFVAEFV